MRGAIYGQTSAPKGLIWTQQIRHVLHWVRALITSQVGSFQQRYFTQVYHGMSEQIEINLDASPWGLGGYVVIDNAVVHYFASKISCEEAKHLCMKLVDCSAQQTAEALAALVALRAWHPLWKEKPLTLRVRSDSISALVVVLKLKTNGKGAILVARELALDVAKSCYEPVVVEHVPGVANKACDMLSRRYQPGKTYEVPALLKDVPETILPVRDAAFFLSITRPPDAEHQ